MSHPLIVRTVLGDIAPEALGVLDYHEHLFQKSPMLAGEELDDEELSGSEAQRLVNAGVSAMVDATPTGLGRDPAAAARISDRTGLTIVHTTGAHHSGHYPPGHWILAATSSELEAVFSADVRSGFRSVDGSVDTTPRGAPVRAGLVKAGIRYWSIGAFEARVLQAAAGTSMTTGCAVMVHLDFGSGTHEVLDILQSQGVPADRVVLAHIDRNPDPGLHAELAQRGAYLGYDGMARHKDAPDSAILDCVEQVAHAGGATRILLGGDVARRSRYISYGGIPGLEYLPRRFMTRLRSRVDAETYDLITSWNGARLLAMPATI